MVAPLALGALAGAASRALVGNAARQRITSATTQRMMASGARSGIAPTRKSIREAAQRAIEQKGASRAAALAAGLGVYQGTRAAASQASNIIQGAVGYAVKRDDVFKGFAERGLGYSMDANQAALIVEEARTAAPITSQGDLSDLPEILTGRMGASIVFKRALPGARTSAVNEFRRYGYVFNRSFRPSQLNAMSNYTYWQAEDATIQGRMPEDARLELAAAFNRGVTVWNDPRQIGQNPTNTPVGGYTL